jgi:hypothetical protein
MRIIQVLIPVIPASPPAQIVAAPDLDALQAASAIFQAAKSQKNASAATGQTDSTGSLNLPSSQPPAQLVAKKPPPEKIPTTPSQAELNADRASGPYQVVDRPSQIANNYPNTIIAAAKVTPDRMRPATQSDYDTLSQGRQAAVLAGFSLSGKLMNRYLTTGGDIHLAPNTVPKTAEALKVEANTQDKAIASALKELQNNPKKSTVTVATSWYPNGDLENIDKFFALGDYYTRGIATVSREKDGSFKATSKSQSYDRYEFQQDIDIKIIPVLPSFTERNLTEIKFAIGSDGKPLAKPFNVTFDSPPITQTVQPGKSALSISDLAR